MLSVQLDERAGPEERVPATAGVDALLFASVVPE